VNAIEFQNLTLRFDERVIISDFSASIAQGEFVGIFGPNGAGKSTLLRAILGLIPPNNGHILLLDKTVRRGHAAIGYIPQFRETPASNQLTGRSYIKATLNGFKWGLPIMTPLQRAEINEVIRLVGIEKFVDRPYAQLSGGERQRISLAEALLGQPEILLLDEPLSGLDPGQQEKMVNLIKSIQQRLNITVLFTAHEVNPLLNVMDRIIYLAHGKAALGSVEDVITSDKLSWLYNAPIEVIRLENQLFVIHKKLGTNVHEHNHPHC
jgi:zinc/manganese transport system ATP-binding protein